MKKQEHPLFFYSFGLFLLTACLTACYARPATQTGTASFPAGNYFQGKALELAEAVDRNDAADVQRLIKQKASTRT